MRALWAIIDRVRSAFRTVLELPVSELRIPPELLANLDHAAIRSARVEVEVRIRELKAFRRTGDIEKFTGIQAYALGRAQWRATMLCALAARNRGSRHVRKFPFIGCPQYFQRINEDKFEQFLIEAAAAYQRKEQLAA